jgi:hypothetical protein
MVFPENEQVGMTSSFDYAVAISFAGGDRDAAQALTLEVDQDRQYRFSMMIMSGR